MEHGQAYDALVDAHLRSAQKIFAAVPEQRSARKKAKPNYRVDSSSSDDDDAFHIKEGSKRIVGGEVIPAKKRRVFIEDTGL